MTMRLAAVVALLLAGQSPAAPAATSVPETIDATARSDVTAELQRFVDSVPDGQTITFPDGASYRIDGTLEWSDRTGITLEGNGARLIAGTLGDPNRAHVRLIDGGGWTIRGLTVIGANPRGGVFDPEYQWQHGFDLRGVDGAVLEDVIVTDVFGDAIYVGLSTTTSAWSRGITIRDSTGLRCGRMAVAVTAGRRVTVDGGFWAEPGLSTFDIEPNGRPGGADRILIENATLGPGSRHRALDITGSGPVSNVTFRANRLTGRPLHVRADQGHERPRNITVQGNSSTITFTGPPPAAMTFRNTDGVTVSGNTQPLLPGRGLAMVAVQGSTSIKVSGQHPYRELRPVSSSIWYVAGGLVAALAVVLLRRGRAKRRAAVSGVAR